MILNYSMESLLSLSICLDFLKPVCGLVLLFYFVLSKVPIRYNGRQKACGQPRVWHVFGSNRSDREGIPSPPCPSWGAPGQSRPVQLLSRQPPRVLQPRGSASRMSWRENQRRQPVEAGPFHHTVPWRSHLLVCRQCSVRVHAESSPRAIPRHGFCRGLCCGPIAQLHPVRSPGLLPRDVWIASRVWLRIESAINISAHSLHRQSAPSLSGEYL